MTEISASLVKELREKSGAGMMDCKKALGETKGNLDEAMDYLRKKGLASAAKKSGRAAAEGLVSVATSGTLMPALRLGGSLTLSVVRRGATSTPRSAGLTVSSGFF